MLSEKSNSYFRTKERFSAVKALSAGFRGGNWNNDATNARTSDRNNAANTNPSRNNNNGGRAVKTSLVLLAVKVLLVLEIVSLVPEMTRGI